MFLIAVLSAAICSRDDSPASTCSALDPCWGTAMIPAKWRLDPDDKTPYTEREFIRFYGKELGDYLWQQATPLEDVLAQEAGLRMAIASLRNDFFGACAGSCWPHCVTPPWWPHWVTPYPPNCWLDAMHPELGGVTSFPTRSSRRLDFNSRSKGRFQTNHPARDVRLHGTSCPEAPPCLELPRTQSCKSTREALWKLRRDKGLPPVLKL